MTSCTIILSHFDSLPFIRAAIRQIRKHAHPDIEQKIIVAEQSSFDTYYEIMEEYAGDKDIRIFKTQPLYSGYGIDVLMRFANIETEYVCQIHADCLPISAAWLRLPITLIEENNFSFVGQLQCIASGKESIYPPTPFFAMAQCYNVARTETYRELSLQAGFTRFHNRLQANMTWENNDWWDWAAEDYINRGSDDDIVAFSWEDKHLQHDKLGLAVTGFIQPPFGRIIEDLIFHFGSCRESVGTQMGEQYNSFTKRINENYDDALINEMVELARANKPGNSEILVRNYWDGKTKIASPPSDELNKRIEELKNGLD